MKYQHYAFRSAHMACSYDEPAGPELTRAILPHITMTMFPRRAVRDTCWARAVINHFKAATFAAEARATGRHDEGHEDDNFLRASSLGARVGGMHVREGSSHSKRFLE